MDGKKKKKRGGGGNRVSMIFVFPVMGLDFNATDFKRFSERQSTKCQCDKLNIVKMHGVEKCLLGNIDVQYLHFAKDFGYQGTSYYNLHPLNLI